VLVTEEDMNRRGILKSLAGAAAAALGISRLSTSARAQTKHIRLYVEMAVDPSREQEMIDLFHNQFVPEAVKHEGYMRVKMLKRRAVLQGSAPAGHNYRFELEFENEELRQQWIASPGHQRVWPPLERTLASIQDYPVTLYDEV
jgi:hypothetical protein|tara:strand:+ start:3785 stop:4216 length:432 start_codon:yes stop_codon:yes gene_type:complete